jgi:hypothetical protein
MWECNALGIALLGVRSLMGNLSTICNLTEGVVPNIIGLIPWAKI